MIARPAITAPAPPLKAANAVLDSFAWSEFLPPKDRRAFLDEFSRTLIASAEMDTYAHLAQVVREWLATSSSQSCSAAARPDLKPAAT